MISVFLFDPSSESFKFFFSIGQSFAREKMVAWTDVANHNQNIDLPSERKVFKLRAFLLD